MSFYLYDNENRNAPKRTNGLRFWGYPSRSGGVHPDIIVIHTAENIPDVVPPDTGAEAIAAYFDSNQRPASAHTVLDTDSVIRLLPDEAVAFHVRGYNTRGWGLEIATQAHRWNQVPPAYARQLLVAAARESARVADKFGIPVAFRTRAQIDSGMPGFTGHTDLDPARRSDPGFTRQQWDEFLDLVRFYQNGDSDMFNPADDLTTDEVAEIKALVRSLKALDPPSSGGFAGPAADLVRRERSKPLHDPAGSVGGVPFDVPVKILPAS